MADKKRILRIGPHPYVVEELPRLQGDGFMALCGRIDYQHGVIKVDSELAPSYKRLTLWHEAIHGILEAAGYKDHDEDLLDAISAGITQILQDNEWIRKI